MVLLKASYTFLLSFQELPPDVAIVRCAGGRRVGSTVGIKITGITSYVIWFSLTFIMMKIYHRPVPNSPCRIVEDTEYGLLNFDHTFHQRKYVMEVLVRFSVRGSDG